MNQPLDFLYTYFCQPILNFEGYNPVNTLVYGIIMFVLAFWVIYPYFNKKGIKFNEKFAFAALLFVSAGSSFRILEDLTILPRSCNPLDFSFYTITPGVYILFGIATIIALLLAMIIAKKTGKQTEKIFTVLGAALAVPFFAFVLFSFKDIASFLLIIFAWLAIIGVTFFVLKFLKKNYLNNKLNLLVLGGQALDGTATFVATQVLNCGDQHPLSDAILGFFPAGFIIIKILIALLIIHFIDKEKMDPNMKGFIKIFIIILGFAPGIRDALTVLVGTCA